MNVLFLCTGNSARSIIDESILNHTAKHRFCGFSAGRFPSGKANPLVIEILKQQGISTEGARSKSWDKLPHLMQSSWILLSPFATTPPVRRVPSGRGSQQRLTEV